MSVDNKFASEFGRIRDPNQNDILNNSSLFPSFESLGDQPITMTTSPNATNFSTSPTTTPSPTHTMATSLDTTTASLSPNPTCL